MARGQVIIIGGGISGLSAAYDLAKAGISHTLIEKQPRLGGVIERPQNKGTVSVAFAGPNLEYLYVCSSDKIYRRKTKAKGVLFFQAPATSERAK